VEGDFLKHIGDSRAGRVDLGSHALQSFDAPPDWANSEKFGESYAPDALRVFSVIEQQCKAVRIEKPDGTQPLGAWLLDVARTGRLTDSFLILFDFD
jgi:hypothetical protein